MNITMHKPKVFFVSRRLHLAVSPLSHILSMRQVTSLTPSALE